MIKNNNRESNKNMTNYVTSLEKLQELTEEQYEDIIALSIVKHCQIKNEDIAIMRKLVNLKYLRLDFVKYYTIPDFSTLTKVEFLSLQYNNFSTFPKFISKMKNLKIIRMGFSDSLQNIKFNNEMADLQKLKSCNIFGRLLKSDIIKCVNKKNMLIYGHSNSNKPNIVTFNDECKTVENINLLINISDESLNNLPLNLKKISMRRIVSTWNNIPVGLNKIKICTCSNEAMVQIEKLKIPFSTKIKWKNSTPYYSLSNSIYTFLIYEKYGYIDDFHLNGKTEKDFLKIINGT